MSKSLVCIVLSMLLTCVSQVLLKKSATKQYDSLIKEYLNVYVILGYVFLGISLLIGIVAYTDMDYKIGPVCMSLNYTIIMILSWKMFGESITFRKIVGNVLIVMGVIIFAFA